MIMTFTKKVNIEAGFEPEFFFNRIFTAGGVRFHVSVMDKANELYHFTMEDKDRSWRIINAPMVPDWIMSLEKELNNIICYSMLS